MVEKVGILDLGTNSFHLLIGLLREGEVRVLRQAREFVFLGRDLEEGPKPVFTAEAMERAISTIEHFVAMGEAEGVQTWVACATEAFRRAENGSDLLEALRHEYGLSVRLLSGAEEAQLIYLGVSQGLILPEEPHLVVDIGGGSVELILGKQGGILHLTSLPLGVTRLQARYGSEDPLSSATIGRISEHVDALLEPFLAEIKGFYVTHLIGSSGTFKTLGRLIAHHVGDSMGAQSIHGYRFAPLTFYPVAQKLLSLSLAERLRLKGMQAERAPLIPFGVVVVQRLLARLPIQTVTISGYALREGILFEYAQKVFGGRLPQTLSQREESVRLIASRYQVSQHHAETTRAWAERLFDELRPLHRLGSQEKEWLAYAAYLHDIGHFINPSSHHKHGQYIVLNSPMPGFSSEELLIIGNLVRYHRKSLPSSEHFHYSVLSRNQKKVIGYLAPLLRLADQLAKYLQEPPKGMEVVLEDTQMGLIIPTARSEAHKYLPAILGEVEAFFERSYNRRLSITFRWVPLAS